MKKQNKVEMMSLEDMISSQSSWKTWLDVARKRLKKVQSIEETKENRWELKSLEASYVFFIDQMDMMVYIYAGMINLAKNDELEQYVFDRAVKELKIINGELRKEYDNKKFRDLNNKYFDGIREAQVITSL